MPEALITIFFRSTLFRSIVVCAALASTGALNADAWAQMNPSPPPQQQGAQ